MDEQERRTLGAAKRRATLGDAYVDRVLVNADPLTREFQELITRYAWGEVWSRPGLDERARRVLVIGTLLALGRWEEFKLHVRAAIEQGGFTGDDVKEVVLQQAIYCGVPAANSAFAHVRDVLSEIASRRAAE
jgi:4-carboxymuconolactone decarboxylase